MTQITVLERLSNETMRLTHIFTTGSLEQKPNDAKLSFSLFPYLVVSDSTTEAEFVELTRRLLVRQLSSGSDLNFYIIQRGQSLAFTMKDVEHEFLSMLKDILGWTDKAVDPELLEVLKQTVGWSGDIFVEYQFPEENPLLAMLMRNKHPDQRVPVIG